MTLQMIYFGKHLRQGHRLTPLKNTQPRKEYAEVLSVKYSIKTFSYNYAKLTY